MSGRETADTPEALLQEWIDRTVENANYALFGPLEAQVEQIRRAHAGARPKPQSNPAWANTHHDEGVLLRYIDKLHIELAALKGRGSTGGDGEAAKQELADQAEELGLGYGPTRKTDISYREPTEREVIISNLIQIIEEAMADTSLRHKSWIEALAHVRHQIMIRGL